MTITIIFADSDEEVEVEVEEFTSLEDVFPHPKESPSEKTPTEKSPAEWSSFLDDEYNKPYFRELDYKVLKAYTTSTSYPPFELIFNAFEMTPLKDVKVVIIGQDPYINYNQAMGLCFSVPSETTTPPSLKNIFKEWTVF